MGKTLLKLAMILAIALIVMGVSSVRNVAESDRFALFDGPRYERLAGPGWVFLPPLGSNTLLSVAQKGEMTGLGQARFGLATVPVVAPGLVAGDKVRITAFDDQKILVGPLTNVK